MSTIDITKEDDGLIRVRVIRLICGAKHIDNVKLDCIHPHLNFHLKCSYKMVCGSLNEDCEFNVWLSLMLEEQKQTRDRPCAVWGNVNAMNGGEKIPLHQSSTSTNRWTSEPFRVQFVLNERSVLVKSRLPPRNQLNCLLWIKFENPKAIFSERNLVQQISELFVKQINCDVQLIFEDNQQIGGHVAILSARSSVFAAMFKHNMKENQRGQVEIRDLKSAIFYQLLYFIYSGHLGTPLSEEDAQPLYVAADKYGIGDLKEECVEFLLSHIRVDNATHLLAWAHLYSVDRIQETALNCIALNGKEICRLDDWANLMKNYPDLCLLATQRMMDNMAVSNKPLQIEDTHES